MTKAIKPIIVNRVMGVKEWSLILLLSVIWGGSFFFIGVAVKELPPLTIVLGRVFLGSSLLLLFAYIKGHKIPSSLKIWGLFLVMGCLNNVIPFCLIVWGQTHIESGLASILNATTPIFSVILAPLLTKDEKFTTNRISGVLLGWVGVIVLIGLESLSRLGIGFLAQLAILGASLSYACAAIFARNFKNIHPVVAAAGMLSCSTLIMLPLALYIDQPWQLSVSITPILAVVGLATICTSVAYLIYFRILASAGATNAVLVTLLVPISAIILGWLFLGERLDWNAFVGMAFIFGGLIIIDGRLLKWNKRK